MQHIAHKSLKMTTFVVAAVALCMSPGFAKDKNNNSQVQQAKPVQQVRPVQQFTPTQQVRPIQQFHPGPQTLFGQHPNTSGGSPSTSQYHRTFGTTGQQQFQNGGTGSNGQFGTRHFGTTGQSTFQQGRSGQTGQFGARHFGTAGQPTFPNGGSGPNGQLGARHFGSTNNALQGNVTGSRHFGSNTVRSGVLGYRGANSQFRRSIHGQVYSYRGHTFSRFVAARYHWPRGYVYRPYAVGYVLPRTFWVQDYFIEDYANFGLDAPPTGFMWVRYGPDVLLIDTNSGQVAQVVNGAFEETDDVPPDDNSGYPAGSEAQN